MTSATDGAWDDLFRRLDDLRSRWPSPEWTYDGRLQCATSSIPMTAEAAARALIAAVTPATWTAATLAEAPAEAQALATRCGGLRAAQLLFWGGEPGSPGAFGLWWPWGDGATVSLRLGLHHAEPPAAHLRRLRSTFGIPEPPARA